MAHAAASGAAAAATATDPIAIESIAIDTADTADAAFPLAHAVDERCLADPRTVDGVHEALAQFVAATVSIRCLYRAFARPVGRRIDASLLGLVCAHCGHVVRGATLCRACRRLPADTTAGAPLLQTMYEGGNPKYAETTESKKCREALQHDLLQLQASQKLAGMLFELAEKSLRRPDPADHWVCVSPEVARWIYYTHVQWHRSPSGGREHELRAGGVGIDLRDAVNLGTRDWLWQVDAVHRRVHALRITAATAPGSPNSDFERLVRWLAQAIAMHATLTFPARCPVDATLAASTLCRARAMQCERCLGAERSDVAEDNPALPFELFDPEHDDDALRLPKPPWAPTRLRLRVHPDRAAQLRRLGLDDDAVRAILLIDLVWTLREGGEIQDGVVHASIVHAKAQIAHRQARVAVAAVEDEYYPFSVADDYRASQRAIRNRDPLVEDALAHAALAVSHVSLQQLATFCNPDGAHLPARSVALATRVHALVPAHVDVPACFTAFLAEGIGIALAEAARARGTLAPCVPPPPVADVLRLCPAVRAWAPSAGTLRIAAAHLRRTPQVRTVLEALALGGVGVRRVRGGRFELAHDWLVELLGLPAPPGLPTLPTLPAPRVEI